MFISKEDDQEDEERGKQNLLLATCPAVCVADMYATGVHLFAATQSEIYYSQ